MASDHLQNLVLVLLNEPSVPCDPYQLSCFDYCINKNMACIYYNVRMGSYTRSYMEIRDAIDAGNFAEYKKMRLEGFEEGKINSKR